MGLFSDGGLGDVVGGAISGAFGLAGSAVSAREARENQRRQIEWERERATHAHQWEVEDLKAAGLNPILSAGGSGAVTGGISAPQVDTSGISGAGTAFINALNTAADTAQKKADTAKTGAEIGNINQDTKNKVQQELYIKAQTLAEQARKGLIDQQTLKTKQEALIKEYEQKFKELAFWNKQANTAAQSLNNVANVVYGAIDKGAGGAVKNGAKMLAKGFKSVLPNSARSEFQQYFSMPAVF